MVRVCVCVCVCVCVRVRATFGQCLAFCVFTCVRECVKWGLGGGCVAPPCVRRSLTNFSKILKTHLFRVHLDSP